MTGDVATGGHYALSASFHIRDIERIIAENVPVERKIALAVAENPRNLSTGTACVAVQPIFSNIKSISPLIQLWKRQLVSHPKNEQIFLSSE